MVTDQKPGGRRRYVNAHVSDYNEATKLHTVAFENGEEMSVDVNALLKTRKLRVEHFPHVLRRLSAFTNTNASPGIAARSMAPGGYG